MKLNWLLLPLLLTVGCHSKLLNQGSDEDTSYQSSPFVSVLEGVTTSDTQQVNLQQLTPNDTILVYVNGNLADRYSYNLSADKKLLQFRHNITRLPGGRFIIETTWVAPSGSTYRIEGH